MPQRKPITIIGGGLAGLTLGIGLRQCDVPVTIWEAGRYPRNRVCGEFISGNGQAVLERLGLLSRCHQAGAIYARTVMFIRGSNRSPVRQLSTPALCLSRHTLDALLAESFQQIGGELRVNSRWTATTETEGVVYASGRRVQQAKESVRWFGVKAHVPRQYPLNLEADLEMHLSPDGYIGVNRIGGGEVNICGLFRAREESRRPESKQEWLRGENGSLLRERLKAAAFDPDSFCSVAGLQLKPQRASARTECCIGDSLTMTPPVTGNGMSMAFESAEFAIEPLAAYSGGQLDWAAARRQTARRCDESFAKRLAWARRLQWMMISPALQGRLGSMLLGSEWLWRSMYTRTR
ncbi:MAG TPA: FAD-dependent monooxygenase [Verrucomicrobiae bacterium]|nr:FAD-dependent monooxygenase [Verrucomicrobiae bacterium]